MADREKKLFPTHYLYIAFQICDRVVFLFLKRGKEYDSATWYSTHKCSIQASTFVALLKACRRSVRALSYSVITAIIDHKVQLLKPLNKRELYAA
jgi:hypothetical protein